MQLGMWWYQVLRSFGFTHADAGREQGKDANQHKEWKCLGTGSICTVPGINKQTNKQKTTLEKWRISSGSVPLGRQNQEWHNSGRNLDRENFRSTLNLLTGRVPNPDACGPKLKAGAMTSPLQHFNATLGSAPDWGSVSDTYKDTVTFLEGDKASAFCHNQEQNRSAWALPLC